MTIKEFNDWATANGLGPYTEITFSDFSGHGKVEEHNLEVAGTADMITGGALSLNIDVT
jgi:hypothetical protein